MDNIQAAPVPSPRIAFPNDDIELRSKMSESPRPVPIESAPKPRSRFRIFAIMSALFLALFLAALDQTIVATAIPTIASDFHSASGYTWVGSAYSLATAAGAPIWAKLSDIWGRKPVLLAAVAVFFVGSIICAVSVSMTMLIVGRAVQGSAGGGLEILVNIVIGDLFSMRDRTLYFGILEFVWAAAGGVGPILGGAFTQLASWRWIWYINLPLSGLAFFVLLIYLDVHNPRTKIVEGLKAVDWLGGVTILGLTLMLLLGLDFGGETFPWNSPRVICLIVFGCLMGVFFFLSEAKLAKYPLMPLALFRDRSNIASLVVCFTHGVVFVSAEYYLPLYFQSVRSASPLTSGTLLLPLVLAEALTGISVGLLIHKTGRYVELIWLGTGTLTLGYGLFIHLDAYSGLGELIAVQIVAGVGAGLLFAPPMIAIQALVSQDDTATATSTFGFTRSLATALSIVIGGVIFQNGMSMREPSLHAAGIPPNITDKLSGEAAAANVMLIPTLQDQSQQDAVKEAFAWSLRNAWIMYCCVALFGFAASFFIQKRVLGREHVETRTGLRDEKERGGPIVGLGRDEVGGAEC